MEFIHPRPFSPLPKRERGWGRGSIWERDVRLGGQCEKMKRYPHYIIDLARKLRKQATPSEEILWECLRNRRLSGLKFKRQHHIDRYIVDFYCAEMKLVVELEGSIHEEKDQIEYDDYRMKYLEGRGLCVMRFRNEEVVNSRETVLDTILQYRNRIPLLPSPNLGEGLGERVDLGEIYPPRRTR